MNTLSNQDGDKVEEGSLKDSPTAQKARRRCEFCDKVFSSKKLRQHINRVHLKIPCPDCGKSFSQNYLKLHRETVHLNKWKKECLDCGLSLRITSLALHRRYYCKGKSQKARRTARCEYCDKVLSSSNLSMHINRVHLKIKYLEKCQDCGKSFDKKHVKMHRETVHLKKRKECQDCGMSFTITHLAKHRRYFKCRLQKHIRNVHNGKSGKDNVQSEYVQCDLCPKRIVKGNMKSHQALHRRVFIKALCV